VKISTCCRSVGAEALASENACKIVPQTTWGRGRAAPSGCFDLYKK